MKGMNQLFKKKQSFFIGKSMQFRSATLLSSPGFMFVAEDICCKLVQML